MSEPKTNTHLKGFNFVDYLKRRLMVGQLDPWRRTDDDEPLFALLIPLKDAYEECIEWSGKLNDGFSTHDITKKEFMDYLKLNNIWSFKNVEEFKEVREKREETRKKPKKELSPERLEQLQKQAKLMSERKKSLHS